MKYPKGSNVEVMIREYGFEESYYKAKIMSFSRRNGYFVQFETLLDDNGRDTDTKYIEEKDIRPLPNQIIVGDFAAGDVVDADLWDGWSVGKVLRKVDDLYLVSFNHGTEEIYLEWSSLRIHREYDGDAEVWYYTKK